MLTIATHLQAVWFIQVVEAILLQGTTKRLKTNSWDANPTSVIFQLFDHMAFHSQWRPYFLHDQGNFPFLNGEIGRDRGTTQITKAYAIMQTVD